MNQENYHAIGMEVLNRKIRERVKKITVAILSELENESIIEYIHNIAEKTLETVDKSTDLNADPTVKAMILDDVIKDTGIKIAKSIINKIDEDYQATLTDMVYQEKRLKHVDNQIRNPSSIVLDENANKELKKFLDSMGQS